MKIERAEPKAKDDVDDESLPADKRRARLADLQRVEATMNEVSGKLAEVERLLEGRDSAPISRPAFYANFYTFSALRGNMNVNNIRDFADQAWAGYVEALTLQPRRTLEERARKADPAPLPAPTHRPLLDPTPIGEATPASLSQITMPVAAKAPVAAEAVVVA